jgi:hypothetical protein
MAVFQCNRCKQVFENDGMHVVVHEWTAGRVCPECLANADTITIVVKRPSPGKPYEIQYVEVTKGRLDDETDPEFTA